MRFPLRWKILLAVVAAPVALAIVAIVILTRSASDHALTEVRDDLLRSSLLFENTLAARERALSSTAEVIARDPRFFAALALPASSSDPGYRATVVGVARDFAKVANADVFEVLDRRGRLVAAVGSARSSTEGRAWLVEPVRRGVSARGVLVESGRQYQVTLTPIRVHDQPAGALLLGAEIGAHLAHELQVVTRSDVSFISGGTVTGTTLAPDVAESARLVDVKFVQGIPGSQMRVVHAGEQTLLTVARPLPGTDPAGGQVYVMQRSLEAETAHLRRLQETLGQLGLVAAIVALVIGAFIASRITRPILEVVRGAEEMERGNYDHPIPVRGRDEIGYLAERFLLMRRHEQVYVNSLQEVARLKSEFISVASHELRTPVTVIQGFGEMFTQLGPLTPEQRRALAVIDENVQALVRITEDATRMAQIEGERLILYTEEHDIAKIVENAAQAALAAASGRSVEVSLDVAPGLEAVVVDGPRLLQAVLQLVRNGIRFTPDGGHVEIGARREGDDLVIEVSDTGIGIPEDRVPMLFERAVMVRDSLRHHSSNTLEFNSGGLGIGLGIARGIVEAHGGAIQVKTSPDQGSRFTIRIPIGDVRRRAAA